MKRFFSVMAAIAIVASAIGPARAADMAAAKTNYDTFCVKCHGAGGKGDGAAAATLATKPRNYTDCAAMAKESDDKLFNVIKNGGKANGLSGDMQAWNTGFDDNEIHDLVAYVRTFCAK